MTLTLGHAPLGTQPGGHANYSIEGPRHRILVEDSPKRLRLRVGGEVVLDTTGAKLLHESNLLPRYYVPLEDLRDDLLVHSDTTSHCPFKGDATYQSVRAGDRVIDNLIWTYAEPLAGMEILRGLGGLHLERLGDGDEVLEEDEVLLGHPHDPYHRVDANRSSRHVRVRHDGEVIAETTRPIGVFETGLPPRWYVPAADVRSDRLTGSDTTTICPYKGVATYRSLLAEDGSVAVADVAWAYEDPLPEATPLPGHLCFDGEGITVEVE